MHIYIYDYVDAGLNITQSISMGLEQVSCKYKGPVLSSEVAL